MIASLKLVIRNFTQTNRRDDVGVAHGQFTRRPWCREEENSSAHLRLKVISLQPAN